MRFQRLSSILGVAVAYFHLGVAAPMEKEEISMIKRATTYTEYCTTDNLSGIAAAVNEAKSMLAIAATRTENLGIWLEALNNGANLNIANEPVLFQSTARTFEAIFGQLWYGQGSTSDNSAALLRVAFIRDFITKFSTGLDTIWNNANFEIYCSDFWLSKTPFNNIPLTTYQYTDRRPSMNLQVTRDFTSSGGICRDVASYYGFVDPEVENNPGNTLSSLASTQYAAGAMSLNDFQGTTFTSALLHELSHARMIVGTDYLDDKACTVPGRGGSAYGWDCIYQLAIDSPSDAIKNADSWTYYITALAFQKNDWSTGVSQII
ncbi:hypothetical protein N7490_000035 [Penicillium lividum]|nr:hypothetical protein N7490_000035 [Penicillium lividum]